MKQTFLILLIIIGTNQIYAQNPVISQRYTADPTGLEYNGRLMILMSKKDIG